MTTIKPCTDLEQSKKLAEILLLESADMWFANGLIVAKTSKEPNDIKGVFPCWSLAALLNVLPEINNISLKMEKVKAEDGYEGYYYPIEYEGIVLIPYSKNPIDACYEMILKLNELKLL